MIGEQTKAVLPFDHWYAIVQACDLVLDLALEDLADLARGEPFAETRMAWYLPRRYAARYDEGFLRKFLVCLATVVWKLQAPGPYRLACVAEELALRAILAEAEAILERDRIAGDFELYRGEAFQDQDHEFLFDPAYDGIEDSEVGRQMAIAHLRFDEWFAPFWNVPYVHPFAPQETRAEIEARHLLWDEGDDDVEDGGLGEEGDGEPFEAEGDDGIDDEEEDGDDDPRR